MDGSSTTSRSSDQSILHISEAPSRHVRPGITHLAVVTAFLLPITLLPYLLARRQLSILRQQLVETRSGLKVVQQELNLSWREAASRREEVQQLQSLLRQIAHDNSNHITLYERKEAERTKLENEVRSDLQKLLKEAQTSRARAVLLRALGGSLADVAAFMHEVELEMGLTSTSEADRRGIERLRFLALQLERSVDTQHRAVDANY